MLCFLILLYQFVYHCPTTSLVLAYHTSVIKKLLIFFRAFKLASWLRKVLSVLFLIPIHFKDKLSSRTTKMRSYSFFWRNLIFQRWWEAGFPSYQRKSFELLFVFCRVRRSISKNEKRFENAFYLNYWRSWYYLQKVILCYSMHIIFQKVKF